MSANYFRPFSLHLVGCPRKRVAGEKIIDLDFARPSRLKTHASCCYFLFKQYVNRDHFLTVMPMNDLRLRTGRFIRTTADLKENVIRHCLHRPQQFLDSESDQHQSETALVDNEQLQPVKTLFGRTRQSSGFQTIEPFTQLVNDLFLCFARDSLEQRPLIHSQADLLGTTHRDNKSSRL